MSSTIDQAVQEAVTKEAFKRLDINKLVTQAIPAIERSVIRGLSNAFETFDWEDFIYDNDLIPTDEVARFLKKKLGTALKNTK